MREKVLETDEILKGSKSTTDAEEKGSISEEPMHQKLKLLVTELPTLVDSLTQDCRKYERSLRHERFKKEMMKGLCKSRGVLYAFILSLNMYCLTDSSYNSSL